MRSQFLIVSFIIFLVLVLYIGFRVRTDGENRERLKFQSVDHIKIAESEKWKLKRDDTIRVLAAYQYEDHIAVTTYSLHEPGTNARCFYYGKNNRLLSDASQPTVFSGFSYAKCPIDRRAKYVTLLSTNFENSPDPVVIQNQEKTFIKNYKAVCVSPIFGSEVNWKKIVKFIEFHRITGFNFFYFTVFNTSAYDQQIIDDYVRLGYVDVTYVTSKRIMNSIEYDLIQQQNCVFKAKGHIKRLIHLRLGDEKSTRHVDFNANEIPIEIYEDEEVQETYDSKIELISNVTKVIGKRQIKMYKSYDSLNGLLTSERNIEDISYDLPTERMYYDAVEQRTTNIYKKRPLYCDELNMQFFSFCEEKIYHCKFRNYESEQNIRHLKSMYKMTTTAAYQYPNW
ncbi:unnamed protein product [Caenorhabditis angaria]|uniref:Glycosyltransferase family 92 protein n=1 Tax=Caenorhabditis angaria TaxID=860376 RepID=A0A9P1N9X1_9PELO|nr:unnamed protein product [Caenorhabditis angaria]